MKNPKNMTAEERLDYLTTAPIPELIRKMSVPIISMLVTSFYNMVDTAFVGQIDTQATAAVGVSFSVMALIQAFSFLFGHGSGNYMSRRLGARDFEDAERMAADGFFGVLFMGVIISVCGVIFVEPIARLLGSTETILPYAVQYLRIIFLGAPFMMGSFVLNNHMRFQGSASVAMIGIVTGAVLNIVLDPLLIFVAKMGVAGAALATAISQLCAGIGCVIVMIRRFPILHLTWEDRQFSWKTGGRMLGVGLPMGLQFSITAIGSVVVQWSVNGLGVEAVAAVSAATKISAFFCCVFDALSSTMATYARQNVGARKLDRVSQGLRAAAVLGIVYCIAAFGIIFLFGSPMLSLFIDGNTEAAVTEMGIRFLMINASFYIPLLFVNIVRLCIQGMGFTRVAMFAGLFEMIARTAVALFVVPAAGFTGACFANPAAWVMADLFLFPCYFRVMRNLRGRLMPGTEGDTEMKRLRLFVKRKKAA